MGVLLIVQLDSVARTTVNAAFTSRMGMKVTPPQGALPAAAISRSAGDIGSIRFSILTT